MEDRSPGVLASAHAPARAVSSSSPCGLTGLLEPRAISNPVMATEPPDAGVLELSLNVLEQPSRFRMSRLATWKQSAAALGGRLACFPRHHRKMAATFALTSIVTPCRRPAARLKATRSPEEMSVWIKGSLRSSCSRPKRLQCTMTSRQSIHIVGPIPGVLAHETYRLTSQQAHPNET